MYTHRIELMGPEYVLMLGVWWGTAVVLMVLAMVTRQAVARWSARRVAKHPRARVASGVRH